MSIWLSSLFPKRGWPHSDCLLGAVSGLCCPLNHAQPLSGNMLAGRSQNYAREPAYNRAARVRARQCTSTCPGLSPFLVKRQLYGCSLGLALSLNHVFRFSICHMIRASITVLFMSKTRMQIMEHGCLMLLE